MEPIRIVGCGVIGATGVGLAVPNVLRGIGSGRSTVGLVLAGFGVLVGAGLVVAAVLIYRSDLDTAHALRIAGWNTLGVVALGTVLAFATLYRPLDLPLFVAASVVGVSAVAHVLIGVNDVRRIRAEELAREREKLSVLNRFVRHDLRTEAQRLVGYAERLRSGDASGDDAVAGIEDVASELGEVNERMERIQRAIERDPASAGSVSLGEVLDGVVEDVRERHPEAEVSLDVPGEVTVEAGEHVRTALSELIENAVVHSDREAPTVRVSTVENGGTVEVRIADDGTGIPEAERAVVEGGRGVTPLEHSSGLGLWTAKWITEAYDGAIGFDPDGSGGTVVVSLNRAGS